MTVSYWQDASSEHEVWCDFCVIGAGVVGIYLARLLRSQGHSVSVLEARHVAAGATGRNAGMVLTGSALHYHDAISRYGHEVALEAWQLSLHNREIVMGLSRELGTPWQQTGSLVLALDDTEAEDLQRAAEAMQNDDIEVMFAHKDPLKRGFAATMLQPGDGGIHPVKFTQALAANSDLDVWEQSEVFAIEPAGQGMEVRSRRVKVHCAGVVLCTNAYAPLLQSYFEGKIVPTRGQVLCTEPLDVELMPQMCYADYGFEYFRQLPDRRLLLGGWRHHFRDAEVGYEDRTTADVQGGLESFMARYFPEVAGKRITHRWSGTMGFSQDGLPLVGSLPAMPDVYFAAGFTGHGLGFGLATAERLVAHILFKHELGWLDAGRIADNSKPEQPAGLAHAD
ncbi:MAG: FAD-binding oxidoreductase [Chloroflexota bacterium]|nr:FAD-binding oxidoreductase [Chloroflexota bacterium]